MLTTETILKAIAWAREKGESRSSKIEVSRYFSNTSTEEKIWCYDFALCEGACVKTLEDIPTTQTLKNKKKERLERELDML